MKAGKALCCSRRRKRDGDSDRNQPPRAEEEQGASEDCIQRKQTVSGVAHRFRGDVTFGNATAEAFATLAVESVAEVVILVGEIGRNLSHDGEKQAYDGRDGAETSVEYCTYAVPAMTPATLTGSVRRRTASIQALVIGLVR